MWRDSRGVAFSPVRLLALARASPGQQADGIDVSSRLHTGRRRCRGTLVAGAQLRSQCENARRKRAWSTALERHSECQRLRSRDRGRQHGRQGRQERQAKEPAAAREEAETKRTEEARPRAAEDGHGRKHLITNIPGGCRWARQPHAFDALCTSAQTVVCRSGRIAIRREKTDSARTLCCSHSASSSRWSCS